MVVACWCHCMHCDWGSFSIFTLGKISHDRYHVPAGHKLKYIYIKHYKRTKKERFKHKRGRIHSGSYDTCNS